MKRTGGSFARWRRGYCRHEADRAKLGVIWATAATLFVQGAGASMPRCSCRPSRRNLRREKYSKALWRAQQGPMPSPTRHLAHTAVSLQCCRSRCWHLRRSRRRRQTAQARGWCLAARSDAQVTMRAVIACGVRRLCQAVLQPLFGHRGNFAFEFCRGWDCKVPESIQFSVTHLTHVRHH